MTVGANPHHISTVCRILPCNQANPHLPAPAYSSRQGHYCDDPIRDSPSYLALRARPSCRFSYTITASERLELLVDRGSLRESHKCLSPPPCLSPTAAATANSPPSARNALA